MTKRRMLKISLNEPILFILTFLDWFWLRHRRRYDLTPSPMSYSNNVMLKPILDTKIYLTKPTIAPFLKLKQK